MGLFKLSPLINNNLLFLLFFHCFEIIQRICREKTRERKSNERWSYETVTDGLEAQEGGEWVQQGFIFTQYHIDTVIHNNIIRINELNLYHLYQQRKTNNKKQLPNSTISPRFLVVVFSMEMQQHIIKNSTNIEQ